MSAWDAIDSWPAAAAMTLLLHGLVAAIPYTAGDIEPPKEFIDFELIDPASIVPEPEPEPEPEPVPEPEPPPGPKNPDPEAAPEVTSAEPYDETEDVPQD